MKPKKSLGQNFLKSKQAISTIVRSAEIIPGEFVLEIGPGKGILTEALLKAGAHVVAIEADHELIPLLSEQFKEELEKGTLQLIQADVLEFDPKTLPKEYKLVANIPYYITGAIIRKFLETVRQPKAMVLLVQKEVADRIVAKEKKESILSLSVKAYGEPKYIEKVPARYFTPAPKVDSAIIQIGGISKNNFKNLKEEQFFEIVRTAFGQKRKTIAKNLSKYGDISLIVDSKARAEDLALDDFLKLTKEIFPQTQKKK
jgi:16S rRNA (adenine1518-N6/adenine1519-N6)-dimethyltransferase